MKLAQVAAGITIFILIAAIPVMAIETSDITALRGFDLVDIITLFTTILAVILGIVSFIGFRRDQRQKFLVVTLAFAIFALKGILIISGDMYLPVLQQPVFDILASLLDFLVLACIFLSITMK